MSRSLTGAGYKGVVLGLLWLTGFYIRGPILAAAPLNPLINADFELSQSALGALTTLPVLMLGLGALPASWLIGRIGARNTVVVGLLVTGIASALRGAAPDTVMLLICTGIMGLGIAAMQPSLPALVPRWTPGFIALGSAVYLNGMLVSEFATAGLTLPVVLPLTGGSWRLTLVLWSVPAILIALAVFYPRLQGSSQAPSQAQSMPAINDGHVWRFGLMLGTTSATYYGVNAYMASILGEKGMADWLGIGLMSLNLAQVLSSALMLTMPHRMFALPRLLFGITAIIMLAVTGFLVLGGAASVYITAVIGFATALQMSVLFMLPPLLRDPSEAGKLAAGMFAIGYTLGFVIPLGAGLIADFTGSTSNALWLIVACNAICLPLAWMTRTRPAATT